MKYNVKDKSEMLETAIDMLYCELEPIVRRGQINGMQEAQIVDMLTHAIKSGETSLAMLDAGYSDPGYSGRGYRGGSYSGRGDYSGYSDRGYSGRDYRNNMMHDYSGRYFDPYYSMGNYGGFGGYSGHGEGENKTHAIEQMKMAMNTATGNDTKEAIKKALELLEKEK